MWSRCRGSMPLNGSSRRRTVGSWTSAAAILTRWRMPFEYVPIEPVRGVLEIDRRDRAAAALRGSGRPWSRALKRTNSSP